MGLFICDFGTKEGLSKYRINGTKKQIEKYIEWLQGQDCELVSDPDFVCYFSNKPDEWTCLVEFRKLEVSAPNKQNDASE